VETNGTFEENGLVSATITCSRIDGGTERNTRSIEKILHFILFMVVQNMIFLMAHTDLFVRYTILPMIYNWMEVCVWLPDKGNICLYKRCWSA